MQGVRDGRGRDHFRTQAMESFDRMVRRESWRAPSAASTLVLLTVSRKRKGS
jgi:hypothetical protein